MKQKGSYSKKNQWKECPKALELREFVGDESVRLLIGPAVCSASTVYLEHTVYIFNDLPFTRPRSKSRRHIIEGSIHVESSSDRRAIHPENSETIIIGKDIAATNFIDILGGESYTYDRQPAPPTVDYRFDRIARIEAICIREGSADNDLIRHLRINVPS